MQKPKITSLADLKSVKKAIDAQAAARVAEDLARKEAERKRKAEQEIFATFVGRVQPLPQKNAVKPHAKQPSPIPLQQKLDDMAVMRESLSDEWDTSSLLEVDEHLSFRRPGIGPDVVRKLRKGEWAVQAHVDLHNLRTEDARDALGQFIRESHKHGLRCVRVVHGKGLNSPGKVPVLKNKVHSWLIQKNQVLAFVQATPAHGGAGALVVLLQPVDAL